MTYQNTQRPVADIVSDLFNQTTMLFRKETQLVRAEVSENLASVGRGLTLVVVGAVLLIPALVILLQAATAALAEYGQMASYWSALIVGGVAFLIGLVLVFAGSGRLTAENLMPKRSVDQLRRDATVVQQQVGGKDDLRRAA